MSKAPLLQSPESGNASNAMAFPTTAEQAESAVLDQGGRTNIIPPSNVNNTPEPPQVLASGIDSLVLGLDIRWQNDDFFKQLAEWKERAAMKGIPTPITLTDQTGEYSCHLNVLPHGKQGVQWILTGLDYAFRITESLQPTSRPSVMVELRSETLWSLGPFKAVEVALEILKYQGADILTVKTSRLDLCLDLEMPCEIWRYELMFNAVTRSAYRVPFHNYLDLSGLQFGRNQIVARLYDKPLEIKQRSRKEWMFQIWGLNEVPDGKRIIRVEFQLRREAIRELGLSTFEETIGSLDNLWAYLTRKWLKFQSNPGKHHTQRTTLPFWTIIQDGFLGIQGSCPLIRAKAIKAEEKQLMSQLLGIASSVLALGLNKHHQDPYTITKEDYCRVLTEMVQSPETDEQELADKVVNKLAKYHRLTAKSRKANTMRAVQGLPYDSEMAQPFVFVTEGEEL